MFDIISASDIINSECGGQWKKGVKGGREMIKKKLPSMDRIG